MTLRMSAHRDPDRIDWLASVPFLLVHGAAVAVTQPGPNRDAIGSWIEVQVGETILRRELTVGGGHIGGQLGPTHFGLGPASGAKVRVTWPDGEVGPWIGVTGDHPVIIERGATEATPVASPSG